MIVVGSKWTLAPVLLSYRIPLGESFSPYGGVTGGMQYAFNDRLSLDAGVKVLRLQETYYTTAGSIELFHAGLTIRF